MPVLVTARNPVDEDGDDLLWPAVTSASQIRLEPGEVVRWRGLARVAEGRSELRAGQNARPQQAWRMTGPSTECVLTDRRLIYRGESVERGTGALATIAWCLNLPDPAAPSAVLVGQVRYQWPREVLRHDSTVDGKLSTTIILVCEDNEVRVSIILIMNEETSGPSAKLAADDFVRDLVSGIASFRLDTRAGQLNPTQVDRLKGQRGNPAPVKNGPFLQWVLPGGLKVGRSTNPLPAPTADAKLDATFEDAASALNRYMRHGKMEDLQRCLDVGRALLTESPGNLAYINLYAGALSARFERSGDVGDLTSAINVMRQVARRAEIEKPREWLAGALSNLGTILIERWKHALDEYDLAQGIAVHEAAVAATPLDSAERAYHVSNLGIALRARYPLTGDLADIDRAIRLYEEILSGIPRRSQDRGDYVANLGFALLDRHRAKGNRDDLKRAVKSFQDALKLIPRGAPARTVTEMALADATTLLRVDSAKQAGVQSAVNAWRKICQEGQAGSQVNVLRAALNWSSSMAQQGDWAMAAEACEFGLGAADRLFHLQLTRERKGLWLAQARELPALAAYALAKLGDLERAAVTVERGRAIFLSEALGREHADLERLSGLGWNDLRERYQRAADQLTRLEWASQGETSIHNARVFADEHARAVEQARAELNQAVTAIRMISGYEKFLAPTTYSELTSAAASSPLVYIVPTEAGGFALIIDGRSGDVTPPTVVWLDALTESTVMSLIEEYGNAYEGQANPFSRQRWRETLESVTRRLWDIVIGPILAAVPADRVTLIPGDLLGLLPLHAAWREDAFRSIGRRYALDDVLITYTPSARALRFAQHDVEQSAGSKVLMVYDSDLRSGEREVEAASSWFNETKKLRRNQASLDMVRAALPDYPVLHFSCHGIADKADPLASHLAVAKDGSLTLRNLFEQRLPGTRLAVLSACETAVVGTDMPEEAVGLPSGLLQAGASGVLGSLWLVGDAATCALMTCFYKLWRGDGLEPAQALRQAQQWVRDSCVPDTEIHLTELLSAGSETHVHPTHWAAFTYTGV